MGWVLVLLVAAVVAVGVDDRVSDKSAVPDAAPTLPPEEAKQLILKKR